MGGGRCRISVVNGYLKGLSASDYAELPKSGDQAAIPVRTKGYQSETFFFPKKNN